MLFKCQDQQKSNDFESNNLKWHFKSEFKDFFQYKFIFHKIRKSFFWKYKRAKPKPWITMHLRVSYVLAVVPTLIDTIQADFINPRSVEEIVKIASNPIPNANCKSKFKKSQHGSYRILYVRIIPYIMYGPDWEWIVFWREIYGS